MGRYLLLAVVLWVGASGCGPRITGAKLLTIVQAKQVPLGPQVEGVWNDPSGAVIAVVHKEGDEYRIVVSAGDTRAIIPAVEDRHMRFGPVPGPEARARAVEAMDHWGTGQPMPKDRFLFALAGTKQAGGGKEHVTGTWVAGYGACKDRGWGNFYMHAAVDADGDAVLAFSIYATKKDLGFGLGGQKEEFRRMYYFLKRPVTIKPSLLERLKQSDLFCRKTAETGAP